MCFTYQMNKLFRFILVNICSIRLFLLSKDWTHQLRIENSKIEDSGLYTVKTNKDSSSCTVHVQGQFKFRKLCTIYVKGYSSH